MYLKNIRVISLAILCATAAFAQITLNTVPTREVGQPQLLANPFQVPNVNPNLVEGREFYNPSGIALDTSATPPILYVSDTRNNRVLAWKNAASFTNGKPADLVIGQNDFFSTAANGPVRGTASAFSTGLAAPTGIAVDQGDLYIADSGNNRVLRFRKPFNTTQGQLFPDLCIGQNSFNTAIVNYPLGLAASPSTNGLALNNGSVFTAAITFDSKHNLWLTDSGNNRVLEYVVGDISKNNVFAPNATTEIGQLDFSSKQPNLTLNQAGFTTINQLATPAGIAFDSAGRLYISDADQSQPSQLSRVMVFAPPFTSGMNASRIMGVPPVQVTGAPAPTASQVYSIRMNGPSSIFFLPGTQGLGVVDGGFHRILLFAPFDQWPDPTVSTSPSATGEFGHIAGLAGITNSDTKSLNPNDGNPQSAATTLFSPQSAIFFNNELYVAYAGNNRVVVLPFSSGAFGAATRVLGQDRFNSNSINLIEGREFWFNGSVGSNGSFDSGLAIDSTGDTPHLYVADPYNNRVLGFNDLRNLKPGSPADIVIGQPDLATSVCNYPAGDPNQPTQSNLCRPVGLLLDSSGNLYVADSLNGRVLRFPAPFSHKGNQQADLVLGKRDFTTPPIPDPNAGNMAIPYGLAFAGATGLLVSDQGLNRVLYFPFTNGTFTSADNGKQATKVFGQPDFITATPGNTDTKLNNPHHVSCDTDGRPYVADAGNGRLVVYDQILNNPASGSHAVYQLVNIGTVEGVFVNSNTGEIWVTDLNGNAVRKFPRFDQLINTPTPTATISSINPVAITQDQYGDLIVAEAVNRVTFYYPALAALNNASSRINFPLAPNTVASIYPGGIKFGTDTASATSLPNPLPLPKTLVDTQVLVNGEPAPLYFVNPTQINFIVPWDALTTANQGNADVQVIRASTGQILAASLVPLNVVSPAIYLGQPISQSVTMAAAVNLTDGQVNGPLHPVKRGDYISIYLTGQGLVANPPADGDIPKNGLVGTQGSLRVFIDSDWTDEIVLLGSEQRSIPGVDNNFIEFSGLSPNYPGLWQINLRIPMAVNPGGPATILVQLNSVASNDINATGYRTVLYISK
jgi:uncharacterized protein (TIGR03437 family)